MQHVAPGIPFGMANSSNCKADWKTYMRAVASPKQPCPDDIVQEFTRDKISLFNVWLKSNKDWGKCSTYFTKRKVHRMSATHGKQFMKRSELEARYGQAKADALIIRLTALGQFADDPNFPGDESERGPT